jgi:hypothetical protein
MTSVKGTAFWGTSALSQSKVSTVEQCQALCSNTSGCSGATYNQTTTLCSLRKGDANIVAGSPTDYSIVPKAKSLLKIVENVNNKLTQVNEKIRKLSPTAEKEFNKGCEIAYFEGQRDALENDIRIKRNQDSCWIWCKSPWDNGKAPIYNPSFNCK